MANRQNTYDGASSSVGYYDDLAPASGLAIWHIDDGLSDPTDDLRFDQNNRNENHKLVDLECADGLFSDKGYPSDKPDSIAGGDNLDYLYTPNVNGNPGDATDLWDGSTDYKHFTPLSNPATHGYDGDRQSVFTGIAVQNITQTKGVMSFDVRFIPSAPAVDVESPRQGTGDDWHTVTLEWSAPTVNATAISKYQYSSDGRTTWSDFRSVTEVSTGTFRGTIALAPDGDTVNYTFQVQAVTQSGQASFPSFLVNFTLDRPGTVALSSNNDLPKVGDQLTATLTDANGSISGQRWQWERTDDDADEGWTSIGTDMNSYELAEEDVGDQVRALLPTRTGTALTKAR